MLYIAQKSQNDSTFGATKLNKILFFADFRAYGIWGESITGATYQHLNNGPCCKQLLPAQDALIGSERARIEERSVAGLNQKRLIPILGPNLSEFRMEQLELVDQVMKEFENYTATQLSNYTHTLGPWLLTKEGEEIPYETVYVMEKIPPSQDDFAWAERVIEELGIE